MPELSFPYLQCERINVCRRNGLNLLSDSMLTGSFLAFWCTIEEEFGHLFAFMHILSCTYFHAHTFMHIDVCPWLEILWD
jgi:hypothetical protein